MSTPNIQVRHRDLIDEGVAKAIPARKISAKTCSLFKYSMNSAKEIHTANVYVDGQLVAQKIRNKNKNFSWLGDIKGKYYLFGSHAWQKGKKIVITEGEIDALSVSEVQNNKWPVVSIMNGAQSAAKSMAANLEYLSGFEEVIIMFDMDEPGIKAAKEAAKALPPGVAKIAKLPLKDPSECLKANRGAEIVQAIWNAKAYQPGGILSVADVYQEALLKVDMGASYPWDEITLATYGRHQGNVIAIGGGIGSGKTTIITELLVHDVMVLKIPTCVFHSEQKPAETVKRVAGMHVSKMMHLPDSDTTGLPKILNEMQDLETLWLYDDSESFQWERIKEHARYVYYAYGVKHFYLDNLTALAAHAEDERRFLDGLMEDMVSFAKDTGTVWHVVSHLATPEGKPHEEGGRVMAKHLKGSRAIVAWAHFILGLERNQQAEDPDVKRTLTIRILKDRLTGKSTGSTFRLMYNSDTGRYQEEQALLRDQFVETDITQYSTSITKQSDAKSISIDKQLELPNNDIEEEDETLFG